MAGEFAFIEHLLRQTRADQTTHPAILGPGDDCALIQSSAPDLAWAITTDMLVSGVHFLNTDPPEDLGWKTLAVNISDLAAMGAKPRYATLAAAVLPSDSLDRHWIDLFFAGFLACARAFDVELVGGDTTRCSGQLRTFSVTALGEVSPTRALRRRGAKPGDDIWTSGIPGYAALGLRAKLEGFVLPEGIAQRAYEALHRPQPRVALGLSLAGLAHSAIDISDGLLQDLGHIAKASGVAATLESLLLPRCPDGIDATSWQQSLLGGGDDYELLFTAPVAQRDAIVALGTTLGLPLMRIGQMHSVPAQKNAGKMAGASVQLLDAGRQPIDLSRIRFGFDHFAENTHD